MCLLLISQIICCWKIMSDTRNMKRNGYLWMSPTQSKQQKAAEEQAKYQSAYAYAQDLGQAKLNRYDTNRAANMDYLNAQLQGQQAAAQRFSQGATYTTNLTEKERKGMTEDKNYWSDVSPYSTYTSTKNPYSTMTSTNSSYNMPSTNTRTMTSVMTQKKPRTQTTTRNLSTLIGSPHAV